MRLVLLDNVYLRNGIGKTFIWVLRFSYSVWSTMVPVPFWSGNLYNAVSNVRLQEC
jgi:hypothetical protein